MKGIKLLFAACVAPLLLNTAMASSSQTSTRPTNRRPTATDTTPSRERTNTSTRLSAQSNTPSRATTTTPVRARTTTSNVRGTTARDNTAKRALQSRTAVSGVSSRTRNAAITTRTTDPKRIKQTRAATTTLTREEIISRDTKKCREVFYGCMDEFCANKDAQLKRCACSSRINEFNGIKKNLEQVEDKLLDFGQRLLTVNMDKEDAAALNQATAGEIAFDKSDTSQSKKMLDEIAKKLNTSFDNSNFDQNLNAISLSLNTESAFDSIDSMAGASTATKSGTALYSAALPVCREMALEVCTPEELSIAEGGYQMMIEQDCNTVKKTYQTQSDQARTKVFESGALLDMSRLDIHQQRNSDDILTCKSKMLNMLTDSTVCGADMAKCLDTSGQYIDPSTGTAILTTKLANLGNLIARPKTGDQTWTSIPQNSRYVSFLNTKKKFLEPATEKCQDISDLVWTQFIEDALPQIKLAQEKKLEQVRQSCTTLLSQCLNNASDKIQDFDERALSIFGLIADKTVQTMCNDVKVSCTALFNATDTGTDIDTNEWESGVTEITTDKTYDTLLSTCREIGRSCIIQACRSTDGNFGLCENVDESINRKAIINRTACWDEVKACVASAGEKTINQIMVQQNRTAQNYTYSGHLYETLYNIDIDSSNNKYSKDIYDICQADCPDEKPCTEYDWQICRLTEQIWGNCEKKPNTVLSIIGAQNKILIPQNTNNETLLSWFAKNTNTENSIDSCRDTQCPAEYIFSGTKCVPVTDYTTDGIYCEKDDDKLTITDTITNCCKNEIKLSDDKTICYVNYNEKTQEKIGDIKIADIIFELICNGKLDYNITTDKKDPFPSGRAVTCNGKYILKSPKGIIIDPTTVLPAADNNNNNNNNTPYVTSYYYIGEINTQNLDENKCVYTYENENFAWRSTAENTDCIEYPNSWFIEYNKKSTQE